MKEFAATTYLVTLVFAVAIATTVVGALIAVLSARLIRSVCGLAICCVGLAGVYYFLHSPFLSLMEILIYVGAICVTIIFAVMLAEPDEAPSTQSAGASLAWGGFALLVSLGTFWGLSRVALNHPWPVAGAKSNPGAVWDIGVALLTTYSYPFELVSLVLLVAILGALVIARYGRTRP